MSDAFVGEIRLFPASYIPEGWLNCNGQVVAVSMYQALYALLGNQYGGKPLQTFGLPNLTGDLGKTANRAVCGTGKAPGGAKDWTIGAIDGTDTTTLSPSQLPSHTHQMIRTGSNWTADKKSGSPSGTNQVGGLYLDGTTPGMIMTTNPPDATLSPQTIGPTGTGGPHENRQPFLTVFFAICYDGTFPTPD
ncbi:phage tail protein [Acidisoma sp. 7E03]